MGLINNIIISIVHLLFVAIDIFLLMIAIKAVYDRWGPSWLEKTTDAVTPIIDYALDYAQQMTMRATRKTYSRKTLLILIVIILAMARFVATSFM